jgi:hypothetical protein
MSSKSLFQNPAGMSGDYVCRHFVATSFYIVMTAAGITADFRVKLIETAHHGSEVMISEAQLIVIAATDGCAVLISLHQRHVVGQ